MIVATCKFCRRGYTLDEWRALPAKGTTDLGDGVYQDFRDCDCGAGATFSIFVDERGEIVPDDAVEADQGTHCPECGPDVRVDAEGLCSTCGRDAWWYKVHGCVCDSLLIEDRPCPWCLRQMAAKADQGAHCLKCGPDAQVSADGICSCGRDAMWYAACGCACDSFEPEDRPRPWCLHQQANKETP